MFFFVFFLPEYQFFFVFFLGLVVTPHCNWSDAILHAVFPQSVGSAPLVFSLFYAVLPSFPLLIRVVLYGREKIRTGFPRAIFSPATRFRFAHPQGSFPPPYPHSCCGKPENTCKGNRGCSLYCFAAHLRTTPEIIANNRTRLDFL